jgi:hypothetical protein
MLLMAASQQPQDEQQQLHKGSQSFLSPLGLV